MYPSNTASRSKSRFQTKSAHRFLSKTANKFLSKKKCRCPKKAVTKYQKKSVKMYPSKESLNLFLARFLRKFVDMEVVVAAVEVMEVDHPEVDTMVKKKTRDVLNGRLFMITQNVLAE